MQRREFVGLATGTLAGEALTACASRLITGRGEAAMGLGSRDPLDARAFEAARRYAETRFGRIAYVERGGGDAALFLHGFPLNGFQWGGLFARYDERSFCQAGELRLQLRLLGNLERVEVGQVSFGLGLHLRRYPAIS